MDESNEVRALEERLLQGDASHEPDTSAVFDELLADDVLFVQGPGNSVGKSGVLRGHQPPRKRTFSKVESTEVEMRQLAAGIVAVSSRTDFTKEGRTFGLRALRIWKREGGRWRVAVVALMEVPRD